MKRLICSSQKGQALVEYALVLAFVAIVAIVVVKRGGTKVAGTFNNIQGQMTAQGG